MRREEKEIFIRKRVLISKGKKNTKESTMTSQVLKCIDFLEKLLIVFRKNNYNYWLCGEIGNYTKECKHRKNKFIKTLGSSVHFEFSKEEALDLALKNNKGIVDIVMEDTRPCSEKQQRNCWYSNGRWI